MKEKQLIKLQEQEKALTQSFVEAVGESKFKEFLIKVFRKKIKRTRRKSDMGDVKMAGEEDEEEEEEENDEDTDSDDLRYSKQTTVNSNYQEQVTKIITN